MSRGICGWVGAGSAALEKMRSALSHRGAIGCLAVEPGSGHRFAADGYRNSAESIAGAWRRASGDPVAFASSLESPFAVAVWAEGTGRLVLARDHLGEKPLYYALTRGGVAFASEIKALRAAGALTDTSLYPPALDAYLSFTYIPAPWTIFTHARKVPAGHVVVFDPGKEPQARRYWALPERSGERSSPADLLGLLTEAMRRRLPDEGPPAAFLSGGLDSSVVVALLAREVSDPVETFSIRFEEARLDESTHARAVADRLGTRHHEILLREVEADLVARTVTQLDEPFADAAAVPTFVLSREASGITRCVLTGDGADALLAGDHWYRRMRRLDGYERIPAPLRWAVPAGAALGGASRYRRYRRIVGLLSLPRAERYLRTREKWTLAERREIYSGALKHLVDPALTEDTYLRSPVEWRPDGSVDGAMRLDAIHGLPEDLLMKIDKMGLAHGVECRSPFLDREFAEWAARADIDLLLRGLTTKYLLKKAAESLLPRDLVYRRKRGLQVPAGRWLKGCLRDLTESAFAADLVRRQGIFDETALGNLKKRFESGTPGPVLAGKVWQIVMFQTWWRQVFE